MPKTKNQITQSFIFAAGRGERMRPLTDTIPKPLVKVRGRPILDYIIEKLRMLSDTIIVNGFYQSEQIKAYLKQYPEILFSQETQKLETGGGLVFAAEKIDFTKPLLLINGDMLWFDSEISDIKLLNDFYQKQSNVDIVLGLKKKSEVLGYEGEGDFELDPKTGTLTAGTKSPEYVFVGLQIINPLILNSAPTAAFSMSHFYKRARQGDGKLFRVKGVELKGKYFHIGTVDTLKQTEDALSKF